MNKVRNLLNRDIKEFNVKLLVLSGILFIALMGLVSYKLTNNSYALFTDTVTGTKTLTFHYEDPPTYVYRWSDQAVSIGDSLTSITGTTRDYTTLNKQFFLKHDIENYEVTASYVCYILNSTEYCLKGGDNGDSYESNKQILNTLFGASNCSETNGSSYSYYECRSGSLTARTSLNGGVNVDDGTYCQVSTKFSDCDQSQA